MKKTEPKGKVGRPKKSPLISPTSFLGIGTPSNPIRPERGGLVEWTYTEVSHFKDTIKTYKSSDAEFIYLYFTKNAIIIKAKTNEYTKLNNISRYLREIIDPVDTFSYFTRGEYRFKIPLSEWNDILDDMDEACNKFTVVYSGGDKLEVIITNASIGCEIKNTINTTLLDEDILSEHDRLVDLSFNNYLAKFVNVKTGDLKGLLGKSGRKNSQNSSFVIKGNRCELLFDIMSDKSQRIEFNVSDKQKTSVPKSQFQIISRTKTMCKINFPAVDLHKFLIHTKNQLMELYLTQNSLTAIVSKPRIVQGEEENPKPHSTLVYHIPIIELDKRSMINIAE
jgi:hypothetical protein